VTKKRQVAPERLLHCSCPSWGEWFEIDLIFIDARVKISWIMRTTMRCFWLKSYCMSCVRVRSVASSLSFSKAMFLLIKHARQSTFWDVVV